VTPRIATKLKPSAGTTKAAYAAYLQNRTSYPHSRIADFHQLHAYTLSAILLGWIRHSGAVRERYFKPAIDRLDHAY